MRRQRYYRIDCDGRVIVVGPDAVDYPKGWLVSSRFVYQTGDYIPSTHRRDVREKH